jgi:REP element-mobilizing transposase RayT
LLYHLVCPTKYRRAILDEQADQTLRDICLEIARRYEIAFLEIGVDTDHAHFLIQSVPALSPSRLAQIIKSLTAREMVRRLPALKPLLWGAAFWSSGYFINTVGHHGQGNESAIRRYIQSQGSASEHREYQVLHEQQLSLF